MITRLPFGQTGHNSTRIIFGAYALSQSTQSEADKTLGFLLDSGINHIDTAPMYGNAEKFIGVWMKNHRNSFFLATKTRSRSYEGARKDLSLSLRQLGVEQIDLWQMHGLTNPQGWEKAMGLGGALEALIEARDKGLVKYLGVTGHGGKTPAMHIQSLERFPFDSVMLPYNYQQMQDPRYAKNFNRLLAICRDRSIAVQTIKSIARRPWGAGQFRTFNTYFYEPLVDQDAIEKCIHWALGLENSFVITAGDLQLLPKIIEAANCYEKTPSAEIMDEVITENEIKPIFTY